MYFKENKGRKVQVLLVSALKYAYNARTPMLIGKQTRFAISQGSLNIGICCLSKTRIQDFCEVLQSCSPSVASESLSHFHLHGDRMASSSSSCLTKRQS